jgi:hypothetical protein
MDRRREQVGVDRDAQDRRDHREAGPPHDGDRQDREDVEHQQAQRGSVRLDERDDAADRRHCGHADQQPAKPADR